MEDFKYKEHITKGQLAGCIEATYARDGIEMTDFNLKRMMKLKEILGMGENEWFINHQKITVGKMIDVLYKMKCTRKFDIDFTHRRERAHV